MQIEKRLQQPMHLSHPIPSHPIPIFWAGNLDCAIGCEIGSTRKLQAETSLGRPPAAREFWERKTPRPAVFCPSFAPPRPLPSGKSNQPCSLVAVIKDPGKTPELVPERGKASPEVLIGPITGLAGESGGRGRQREAEVGCTDEGGTGLELLIRDNNEAEIGRGYGDE